MKRFNGAWIVPLVLVAASVSLTGCQGGTPRAQVTNATSPVTVSRGIGSEQFVQRDRFTSQNFGLDKVAEAEERLGLTLHLPSEVAGGVFEGVYLPEIGDSKQATRSFVAVYSNDVVIEVSRRSDAKTAQRVAESLSDLANLGGVVTRIQVRGREAFVRPRLDIKPVALPDGTSRPGTGIRTTSTKIVWAEGDLVIQVMSPLLDASELRVVADDLLIEVAPE